MKKIFRSEADANTRARRFQVTFNGDALGYFKIWIVNYLYIILTLGLYYPWAKVRSKRYLIANFSLGESTGNFDYLARGWNVFLGRVIGVGVLGIGILTLMSSISSATAVILYICISFILLPWFIVRSMAFSARYACFRGLHFSFDREYLPVYIAIFTLLGPALVSRIALLLCSSKYELLVDVGGILIINLENAPLPLLLFYYLSHLWTVVIWPRTLWVLHKYKAEHYSLGTKGTLKTIGFSFETRLGAYYSIFIRIALPLLLLYLGFFNLGREVIAPGTYFDIIFLLLVPIVLMVCFLLYRALLLQCFWGGVRLKGRQGRIRMKYPISEYMCVQFRMFYATLLSLGLLRPWAKVYQCKYLAQHTFLEAAPGELEGLMEGDEQAVMAIGAEYINLAAPGFDLDFGWE